VAVARALAPRPPLILLDEPFSALDAALRVDLRRDIRRALHADGATAVLVTHDQGEALSTADQVAVMHEGVIVQSGSPVDVYRSPATAWVASFVGDAVALAAESTPDGARTSLGLITLAHPSADNRFTVLVRPEQVRIAERNGGVTATVIDLDYHGHDMRVVLRLPDATEVLARVSGTTTVVRGTEIGVSLEGTALLHFPTA
jgi:iron(III) transport system ATP-binding protein